MRSVVAVLRGGPSSEYEVSLKSGNAILNALNQEKYEPRDIFISRGGEWHLRGAPVFPERALKGVDVAFNVAHGEYGENGRLHQVLDSLAVPYTGSDLLTSSLVFNKHRTKEMAKKFGVKTPRALVVEQKGDTEQLAMNIFRSFPHPAVVKPVIGGSSVGIALAESYHSLLAALEAAFTVSPKVLVEEYIRGREATVGVVDHFRGERAYALLPVEIIPVASVPFFTYDAKYDGSTIERVPGNFSESEKQELMQTARTVHEGMGLRHYSRSDFIISRRGIYFLEINNAAAVGMSEGSLMTKALAAVGTKLSDFVDHVVSLVRHQRK